MIPPIAEAVSTDTARLDFPEPLSWEHQRIIELLTERYEGKDTPFMVFSRDNVRTLIVPKAISRIGYGRKDFDPDSFATKAPTALRIPDGAGASNV